MTDEERQRRMDFILDQQAQLTANLGRLTENVDRLAGNVGGLTVTVDRLAEKVDLLTDKVDHLAEKVDRTADSVTALLAIAEIHDREIKETDERLNALINIVERHINEGRNGKG